MRFLPLFALLLAGCAAGPGPDLILYNGDFWTGNPDQPHATALAIDEGSIVAVGDDGLVEMGGSDTRVIDLGGRFAVPGFNDTHVHAQSAARFLEFNVMQAGSQEEFQERVQGVVDGLAAGEWILGGFWGAYDDWASGSAGGDSRQRFTPDIAAVETLTAEHPMFIRRFDNSEFAANRAALDAAGIDVENPSAPGVTFETDASGHATGIMTGSGVRALFADAVPDGFSLQRRMDQTRNALRVAASYGVTSFSDMSDDEQLEIYRALRETDELSMRVHFRYFLGRWQELAAQGIEVGHGDEWIRLGALKGHIDGIMGTSSARFFQPYENQPGNYGRWRQLMVDEQGQFVEGQFLGYMARADSANLQLSIHAIGDEANSLLMDYLEELNRLNGDAERRFRLVHAQVIDPREFDRLGRLGVIAEVQPYHLADDMRWMEERIGYERSKGAYAFRSLDEGGGVLAFGSDWPGTSASEYPINPIYGLYAAVTRQTLAGTPEGGWFPEEKIDLETALRAYTWGGAYSTFEEDIKGTLEEGKLADVAVLSDDLFETSAEDWLETDVVLTVVGGKVVHDELR
ncbi:MAG: amidohydrolase [Rhodothermales bacterium]|nr:amidohydrolase [Rhodothermales bacterium]MBO6780933.1 amidohydrolase [Rhodothermales bacterium]